MLSRRIKLTQSTQNQQRLKARILNRWHVFTLLGNTLTSYHNSQLSLTMGSLAEIETPAKTQKAVSNVKGP